MRSRFLVLTLLFTLSSLAFPLVAYAGIPFFGPIIPQDGNQAVCPASWGMVLTVINNVISFSITIAIVFLAPLTIGYAGFLMVFSPTSAGNVSKARGILLNTVVGIVIALSGWMIVAAIMAVLYNPSAQSESGLTRLQAWSTLMSSGNIGPCLEQRGALPGAVFAPPVPRLDAGPGAGGGFTYQPGIEQQRSSASAALNSLLSCMSRTVPAGVGRISSISDCQIVGNCPGPQPQPRKSFQTCAAGGCQHAANSCHYGGGDCVGQSYAVDFGDDQNKGVLSSAANACGAQYIGDEGGHLHVSVGQTTCGCN